MLTKPNPKSEIFPSVKTEKLLFVKLVFFCLIFLIYEDMHQRISLALINEVSVSFEKILLTSIQLPHFWTDFLVSITYLYIYLVVGKMHNELIDSKSFTMQCSSALNKIGYAFSFIGFISAIVTPIIEIWIRGGQQKTGFYMNAEVMALIVIGATLSLIAHRLRTLQNKVDSFV